jgi:hypothetical protein
MKIQFLWVTIDPIYKLTTGKLSVQYALFTYVSICSFWLFNFEYSNYKKKSTAFFEKLYFLSCVTFLPHERRRPQREQKLRVTRGAGEGRGHSRCLHGPKFQNFTQPEDHSARPSPSPKFTFRYVTRPLPKPDCLSFLPEWSPYYLQFALTVVLLIHVSCNE